jgi:hypothetical protein
VLPDVLGHDPFTDAAVRDRTAANLRFLATAIAHLADTPPTEPTPGGIE